MRCTYCKEDRDRVVDSRSSEGGEVTRRRRECLVCGRRYTSYERVEASPLKVVKKDGKRVPFERSKIAQGIEKACWNLPVAAGEIEAVVDRITTAITEDNDREVPSNEVGNLVMRELRDLNEVAYVRFASVYREFKDVTEFRKLLEEFVKGGEGAGDRRG